MTRSLQSLVFALVLCGVYYDYTGSGSLHVLTGQAAGPRRLTLAEGMPANSSGTCHVDEVDGAIPRGEAALRAPAASGVMVRGWALPERAWHGSPSLRLI